MSFAGIILQIRWNKNFYLAEMAYNKTSFRQETHCWAGNGITSPEQRNEHACMYS